MKFPLSVIMKFSMLLLLVVTFVVFAVTILFTWTSPEAMIDIIKTLRPGPTSTPIRLTGVAVLGDSQSDEYRADDRRGDNFASVTYNWVELLQKERNIPFGEWGLREEPRRTGYAYNWARSGATARSMIESGQHIGAAQQVAEGNVNAVIIYIGANDYAPFITEDGYEAIYNGTLSDAQLIAKRNRIVSDIKTAIDVVQKSGDARILLVTIPDWGNNFGVSLAFPIPEQRQRVAAAVSDTNAEIEKLAQSYSIPVMNPNSFYKEQTTKNNGSVVVGRVKLERLLINNDPKNMFLDDGIHPGTVLNALFANEVIKMLNLNLGTTIRLFSDEEILKIAGL